MTLITTYVLFYFLLQTGSLQTSLVTTSSTHKVFTPVTAADTAMEASLNVQLSKHVVFNIHTA